MGKEKRLPDVMRNFIPSAPFHHSLVLPVAFIETLRAEQVAREEEIERERQREAEAAAKEASGEHAKAPPPDSTVLPSEDRLVPVFAPEDIARSKDRVQNHDDADKRFFGVLEAASRWDGRRRVMGGGSRAARNLLSGLAREFPNFRAVIEGLAPELALALALPAERFRIAPLLLHGAPGVGKTYFAATLAERLGLGFGKISAGGAQGGFELCGTSKHYGTAAPGRVFMLLAQGDYATPVLLIDEIDKISQHESYPVMPALLDLLEEHSARQYQDVSMDLSFDASRIVVIATANDIEDVPAPLLSRMQAFEVQLPNVGERRLIAERLAAELLAPMPKRLRPRVDPSVLDRLAQAPVDLRELTRRLRQAVGKAVMEKRRHLRGADIEIAQGREVGVRIGFV